MAIAVTAESRSPSVLLIEPFYGGSHKQLMDFLEQLLPAAIDVHVATLPAKKWPWRARTSALAFSRTIPRRDFSTLFCSAVLNVAELVALRPDLRTANKVLYFHENQIHYPVQSRSSRPESSAITKSSRLSSRIESCSTRNLTDAHFLTEYRTSLNFSRISDPPDSESSSNPKVKCFTSQFRFLRQFRWTRRLKR